MLPTLSKMYLNTEQDDFNLFKELFRFFFFFFYQKDNLFNYLQYFFLITKKPPLFWHTTYYFSDNNFSALKQHGVSLMTLTC